MSDLLFHYCPTQSFHSIITAQSIWLSSLSASNDSMEGRLAEKFLLKRLENANLEANQIDKAKEVISSFYGMSDGLGFCLSTECDRLSQWRGYADDGRGFAIGFSKDYLKNEIISQNHLHGVSISLEEVIYKDKDAYESEFSDEIFELLMKVLDIQNNSRIDRIMELMKTRYKIKNDAFKEESEWRLLTFFLNRISKDPVQYRPSGNQLTPYLPLELISKNKAIAKVVIGPKNVTPIPIVEKFLSQWHYEDVEVVESTATYR